jgi:hypothetical protein
MLCGHWQQQRCHSVRSGCPLLITLIVAWVNGTTLHKDIIQQQQGQQRHSLPLVSSSMMQVQRDFLMLKVALNLTLILEQPLRQPPHQRTADRSKVTPLPPGPVSVHTTHHHLDEPHLW